MTLTLTIPFFNQLNDCKTSLGVMRHNTSDDTEWMIIDNGSTDKVWDFMRSYLKPKKMNYIRNENNTGPLRPMQQAYENCETEILGLVHNDVAIFEKDWDKRVIKYFEEMPDLGAAGLFGSAGCGPYGERIQDVPAEGVMAGMSNMLEAEIHGIRLEKEWAPCSIFDGFAMFFRMDMLKKGNGFDQRYKYHHIYDRDAGLESLRRGYKNIVINLPCHHIGGITANRPEYQEWIDKEQGTTGYVGDKKTHDDNSELFAKKFEEVLPLYVNPDFSFRAGKYGQWDFKGDLIQKMKEGD